MCKISFEFDENFISKSEPLSGVSEEELYALINSDNERDVAYAFAGIFNQGEHLLYLEEWECKSDEERALMRERYYKNRKMELECLMRILKIMGIPGDVDEPPLGYYYVVEPFMKRNGFLAKNRVYIKTK